MNTESTFKMVFDDQEINDQEKDDQKVDDQNEWSQEIIAEHNEVEPNPNQPRKFFDPDEMKELEGSLRGPEGQRDAVKVMPKGPNGKYMIIGGERRWTALGNIGSTKIRLKIYKGKKTADELFKFALKDNLQHSHMSHYDMAMALLKIHDDTPEASDASVAREVSLSYQKVRKYLIVARMHPEVSILCQPDADEYRKISFDSAFNIASKVEYDDQPAFIERAAKAAERLRNRKPNIKSGISRNVLLDEINHYKERQLSDSRSSSIGAASSSNENHAQKLRIDPKIAQLVKMSEKGKIFGDAIDQVNDLCSKKEINDFFRNRASSPERDAMRVAFRAIKELADSLGYEE